MTQSILEGVRCTVPSHPKYLPLVRAIVSESAVLANFSTELTSRILLAVTEAVTNVIRHAYGNDASKPIELEVRADSGTLRLDVTDYATFVDPKHIASRPLDDVRPGGLGVHLIKTTMDHVVYAENVHGGTTLTMIKHSATKKEPS